jgi:cytochrome d ubiquinol oxidase subunit I
MEYVTETGPGQDAWIGGIYDDGDVRFGIRIPNLDSILVGFSTDTVVTGLDRIPDDEQPPSPTLLHLAFDAMVGIGTALLGLGMWFGLAAWRRRALPRSRWFWRAAAGAGAAAVVALWCGWIVTEVGRQPWIVYGHMRTEDAVTGASNLWIVFTVTIALYAALAVGTVLALRLLARRWRGQEEAGEGVPYGPPPAPGGPA